MTQRLHLVFGGELTDPTKNVFKNVDELHIVGLFRTTNLPTTHGRPKHSAPSITRICAITSPTSTGCATRRRKRLPPKSLARMS